jgi:hypothetical protein
VVPVPVPQQQLVQLVLENAQVRCQLLRVWRGVRSLLLVCRGVLKLQAAVPPVPPMMPWGHDRTPAWAAAFDFCRAWLLGMAQ